ncbi:cytochrome c maturation protein CcmE [Bradymonadaceae bacterium TMQ3]|nr:cytochrome c maturation protein CcmE [Bradymonadaceae bacterium TMQ3]TXC77298.1 cytochrome c maturation protein CcmE [Bradymonadales bacterium TMQ1]
MPENTAFSGNARSRSRRSPGGFVNRIILDPAMTSHTTPPSDPNAHGWDGDLDADLLDEELDGYNDLPTSQADGPSWGLIIGVLVAIVAIAFLVLDGLEGETYFYEVDQAVAKGDDLIGKTVRVKGIVEPGSFEGVAGGIHNTFRISEQGVGMKVVYTRALPDTFQEDSEVVAQGVVDETLTLHADEVLVKCPSRYEGAPPTGAELSPQAAR